MRCPSGTETLLTSVVGGGSSACECVPRNVNGLREYGFSCDLVGVVYGYFSVHRRGD
jgi:hypothetical protein